MEVHHDHTAAADGEEETGSSFTWESQFLSRVNAHQTLQGIMPLLMEGATSMKYGVPVPTECAVTIVKETGVFEKLLMEKLSAYMCPIIGISSLNGWLLVHFWEGDSYAVDLGALSPGSNQGKAHPRTKIAGGTPDNIHKWAIIHSVGRLLSDDSILKVVYDVLHVSHDLGENAGLKIVRVFDVLEADRIIRGHSFLMPLAELLQIYGMVPNSCVDIVVGSQRTPVVDDPLDYCGKSQRQAIKNLREMAQVSSKMIPFLYQAMLSIMSAPMLAELNQRSNASVQSPQQLDCWYNPRRGDMVSGPENVPSHPSSYAAALAGMATAGNDSTQQAPCLVQAIESYTEEAKYNRTELKKQKVTQNKLQQKYQGDTQEQHQQGEEMESVESDITSQKESHGSLHLVTSNIGKETKQQPHFDCNAKTETVQRTYANALQVKAGCLTENAIMKQAPPRLTRDETSDIEETSHESILMHSQDLPPKVQKHEHHENCGSQSEEQVNCPQVASAQGDKLTWPSVAASSEKKKQQENCLDKSVKPKTNQSASSVGAVAATNVHQKQQKQQEQLQECIQTSKKSNRNAKRRRKKKNKKEKESPPQLKSNQSGGNIKTEPNQMPPAKIQNDVKPKKSSVTSACGPANPQEQTGPSKSPLSLGVPVGKEKNQLKVKVQNDVKPKESRGIGASGPPKTKEQPKQSKSLLSSKEKEKGKMSQQGVQNDVKRKNNSAPKAKEQSKSSKNPFVPKDTVKKEQKTLPQQKTQNDVKPRKSSVTSDKTSAKTQKQNSSSKSCPSPGATNKKGQNQMPQPKVQNDKKAEKSSLTSASGPAKAKEQPSKQDKHQQKQQENSEVINAVKAESKKKTESSQKFSDKPACVAKTQEQNSSSKSCPTPGATNKKGQNQMPQPKVQNDKKAEKNSEIGACGLANTKDQASSSKSSHTPREVVKKEQSQVSYQKLHNDVKSKKHSVTSSSVPVKAKEQPSQKDKHQQKQQENSEVINAVKVESKKKTESSQKFSDKPACVAKTQEQNSSSKSCPTPGATNKKGQNQMPQPKVQNDKKAEKNSEIGACGLANTKDQASSSKSSHTPREVVKKEQSQVSYQKSQSDIPVKAKEQLDKHQQKQENSEVNAAVNAESNKEPSQKLFDKPALKSEKEHVKSEMTHHRQRPTLFKDCLAEKRESDASTSSISFTEQAGRQEQKDFPQNDQVLSNTTTKPKSKLNQEQNAEKEDVLVQLFQDAEDMLEQVFQDAEDWGADVMTSLAHTPQQQQQQNTNVQQQHHQTNQQQQKIHVQQQHQTHQQQQQPNTHVQQQHHQTHQQQQQSTNVQQHYQTHQQQQQQNTHVQQQHQTHQQQQQQKIHMQEQHQTQQQQQQQNTNVQQQYHKTHHQKQQNADVQQQHHQTHQQQQQNTNVWQQYHQTHQQQQNTNVQQQYYQIHQQQQQQITNVPYLAPGIIPQFPMGLMLQAQTLPPQQVTFVQWEQQQWVKTSPETKLSTSPQWMKPMVLQFKEGNNPVFIHPLSEQASIPINPCLITDEQDEEFDDLLLSDVIKFVEAFPANIQLALQQLSQESSSYSFIQLAEIVLDVGRKPKARYLKSGFGSEMMEKVLNHDELAKQDLKGILEDNSFVRTSNSQAMVRDTLHRLGLLANLQGEVIGITAKVEHPLPGCLSPLYDIFNKGKSILVVGPTGVGKTTLLREAARVLSDVEKKNVIIIDTLSEIAGEGDIPHQSIGSARRLQVIEGNVQHKVMSQAYQNHKPEIVIIDEISSLEDAEKTLDMKLRGIQLIAGVQGKTLADVLLNTALTPITGGIQESVGHPGEVPGRLRTGPVVFDVLVEMFDMERWIIHWDLQWAIDAVLPGGRKTLGMEERKVVKLGGDPDGGLVGQQVLAMRMSSTYKIYTQ